MRTYATSQLLRHAIWKISAFQQEHWVFPFTSACIVFFLFFSGFFMQAEDRRIKSLTIKTSVDLLKLNAYITFIACL